MLNSGLAQEQIDDIRAAIRYCQSVDLSELMAVYNLDRAAGKMLKAAATPDPKFTYKDAVHDVNGSGLISSSKLLLTQTTFNKSTPSKVDYDVQVEFVWLSPYAWAIFSDKVITAWGGDLTQRLYYANIYYWNQLDDFRWGNNYIGRKQANYFETSINRGGYYVFPQNFSLLNQGKARHGIISYNLSQLVNNGLTSKILAEYAHQKLVFGTGISISGSGASVGIHTSYGYDTSIQVSTQIIY